ncbi:WW domain binding protein 11-domain-containing protein [Nemania sp. FL0916]|nr:WW domain binding protein 11-domain-containing protein [Nemania sp. FL0916]
MPKERNFNPVQAQRKADKAKAIKKGKAEVTARRNEKLAKRNPERLQKQIDDLKQITESGGKLTAHEQSVLDGLERDHKAVLKARDALGDRAPSFARSGGPRQDGGGALGKRRRGHEDAMSSDDDDDVPDDVKSIPMPRDTPPPISKEVLDKWYAKRRAARGNPNDTPLGDRAGRRPHHHQQEEETTPAPAVEVRTVYEAKPMVRDLRKEAVSAFVPTAVQMKLDKSKGIGGLMDPEEADRLEKEGYLKVAPEAGAAAAASGAAAGSRHVTMEEVEDEDD